MTDLNKKEKIFAIVSYVIYSAILTYQRYLPFSAVYFLAVAVPIVLADKIFEANKVKLKTLSAFVITAVGYPTMFEIFFSVHNDVKYILTAIAVALFFACVFAFTDKKKMPLCIAGAPVLCCLNIKIAICYSVFLLCLSIAGFTADKNSSKGKGKNKKPSADKLAIISAAVSLICICVCILLIFQSNGYVLEQFDYLLARFKNPLALLVISAYLLFRLFKSSYSQKKLLIICLVLFAASAALGTAFLGWSVFALICLCVPLFLGIICLEDPTVVDSIKADCTKNKFLFLATIICALQ